MFSCFRLFLYIFITIPILSASDFDRQILTNCMTRNFEDLFMSTYRISSVIFLTPKAKSICRHLCLSIYMNFVFCGRYGFPSTSENPLTRDFTEYKDGINQSVVNQCIIFVNRYIRSVQNMNLSLDLINRYLIFTNLLTEFLGSCKKFELKEDCMKHMKELANQLGHAYTNVIERELDVKRLSNFNLSGTIKRGN